MEVTFEVWWNALGTKLVTSGDVSAAIMAKEIARQTWAAAMLVADFQKTTLKVA
jgi:hypothetical protein